MCSLTCSVNPRLSSAPFVSQMLFFYSLVTAWAPNVCNMDNGQYRFSLFCPSVCACPRRSSLSNCYMSAKVCWVCVIERIQVLLESSEGDCWSHPSKRLSSAWSLMGLLNQSRSLSVAAQQNEKSGNWLRSQGWESYKGDKVIKTSSCPACWLVLSDPSLPDSQDRNWTSFQTKLHQQLEVSRLFPNRVRNSSSSDRADAEWSVSAFKST